MSFYSDAQSQRSSVPPSAQPYRSLFGGSSQGFLDQESYPSLQEDEPLDQLESYATASGGPSIEYAESDDDLDYIQTSDRESSHSPKEDGSVIHKLPVAHAKSASRARESESSTSPPPYRPNRFHGTARLWLDLTRDDREIVDSLDEVGARDLAAHLYNVHILQSQGVAKLGGVNAGHPDESRPEDKLDKNDRFLNSLEEWTAWPMPSDEVPRTGERLRRLEDDRWTFRMKPDPRPSAELEDCITAFLLKTAKERFQLRGWGSPIIPYRKSPAQSDTDGPRSGTERDLKDDLQSSDEWNSTTEFGSEEESSRFPARPIVQIDDDESRRKLRPLARNTITQFENLLMGLHRFHGASQSDDGRSNRSRSRGRKRSRSSSLISDMSSVYSRDTPTEEDPREERTDKGSVRRGASFSSKKLTRAPERSGSRGRKRTRRTPQSSHHGSTHESARTSRQRTRSMSTNSNGQTGLTDWREVAGVGSMVGISPVVLQRATERFSALVSEDAGFPSKSEGPSRQFMESRCSQICR
ncbi:hypothetical protein BJX76DRAFT_345656 [Aspergillus varians]